MCCPGVTRRDLLRVWTDLGQPYRIDHVAPDELRTARAVVSTSSISGVVLVDQIDDHLLTAPSGAGRARGRAEPTAGVQLSASRARAAEIRSIAGVAQG